MFNFGAASYAPLIAALGGLLIMLLGVIVRGRPAAALLSGLVLALSGMASLGNFLVEREIDFGQALAADNLSGFGQSAICLGAILCLLVGAPYLEREGVKDRAEFYALYLFSTCGALLLVSANELVTAFLGLEIMSLALYALCASALGDRASSESGLKYFLLGSFGSAFLLYGIALVYGLTGTTQLVEIGSALQQIDSPLVHVVMGFLLVGMLFKLGAAPFHFWVPDVYQGAPTAVTVYMAGVVKVAAVIFMLRIIQSALGSEVLFWSYVLIVAAVLSMLIGNLSALRQRSMKRMLAFSSIAHAGYMLLGFLALRAQFGGAAAVLYYAGIYLCVTVGAFAVLVSLTGPAGARANADDISIFNGIGRRRPLLALAMTIFMLTLAGLPPGLAGLLGKFYLFSSAVSANHIVLVVLAVLNSALSCCYYLRIVLLMFFVEDAENNQLAIANDWQLGLVCLFSTVACVLLGLFPGWLYSVAQLAVSGM